MSASPTKEMCVGCRNDFYNGKNSLGVGECWSFKSAKVVTRFQLHRDTPMNQRSGYRKMRTLSCYHGSPFVYLDAIPEYAK